MAMLTTNKQSLDSNGLGYGKYNVFINEMSIVFDYLKRNITTVSMIAYKTGISQENVTQIIRVLERERFVKVLFKSHCKHSGLMVSYLTTNESLIKSLVIWNN